MEYPFNIQARTEDFNNPWKSMIRSNCFLYKERILSISIILLKRPFTFRFKVIISSIPATFFNNFAPEFSANQLIFEPGNCFLSRLNAGIAWTISPSEDNRIMAIFLYTGTFMLKCQTPPIFLSYIIQ